MADLTESTNRVYQLTIELLEAKKRKKDTAAAYNDEIKRIEKEIKELIYDEPSNEEPEEET